MNWGLNFDYHGSRPYETEPSEVGEWGLLRWIANFAHGKLGALARRGTSTPTVLLSDGEPHFSLLGKDATADDNASFNACDWRVLP